MPFATTPSRSPSPTASIASSRASQRPGLPVKPGHLSVAHTGTATSVAFQHYIRAQVTGGSEVGSRQSAYQQAEADDDEDGEDEAQWMTIKAAAAAAPVDVVEKRLPLQEVFSQRMNAQGTNLATSHGPFASSASTIKGSRGLAAELLLRGESSQDTNNGSPSVSLWLEQTKQAVPSVSPSKEDDVEQDAASSTSGLPTDQGSPDTTIHSQLAFRLGATTLPIALLPHDKSVVPSNSSHHAIERSRDPSIVTNINGSKMAQWDLHTPPKEATKPSQLDLLRLASAKRVSAPSSPLLVPPSPGPLSNSLPESKPARALFTFKGERAFNELSLLAGQSFQILDEKLQGGWSLAMVEEDGVCCKGLVPQGWYTFERLMAPPPPTDEGIEASTLAKQKKPLSTYLAPAVAASAPISVQAEQVRNAASSSTMTTKSPRSVSIESMPGRAADSLSQFLSRARTVADDKPAMVPCPLQSEVTSLTVVTVPADAQQQTFDEPTTSVVTEADLADALSAQSDCEDPPTPVVSERTISVAPPFARTLRRWSPFVASGAEEYLLSQTPERQSTSNAHTELDRRYDIVTGSNDHLQWTAPRQYKWLDVHDPLFIEPSNIKQGWLSRSSTPFVTFQVTIASADSKLSMPTTPYDPTSPPADLPVQVQTVSRRFKHFVQLADMLSVQYPLLFAGLPPLPTKSFAKRLDSVFVEQRRRELGNWLERVVRHPVLGEGAATTAFLTAHAVEGRELPAGEEALFDEWEQFITSSAQRNRSLKSHSFAKTYHPEFAIDLDEVAQEGERFAKWSQRIEGRFRGQDGSSSLRYEEPVLAAIDDLREDLLGSSQCYRGLSGSLTRLVQSDEPSRRRLEPNGCWREDCEGESNRSRSSSIKKLTDHRSLASYTRMSAFSLCFADDVCRLCRDRRSLRRPSSTSPFASTRASVQCKSTVCGLRGTVGDASSYHRQILSGSRSRAVSSDCTRVSGTRWCCRASFLEPFSSRTAGVQSRDGLVGDDG